MARDTLNPEGLTFEEWVCAAGMALFDRYGVRPYSESSTSYRLPPNPHPGTVLLVCYGNTLPRGIPVRHSHTNYPKKIRDAWRNGEDPTDWRKMTEDKAYAARRGRCEGD